MSRKKLLSITESALVSQVWSACFSKTPLPSTTWIPRVGVENHRRRFLREFGN